jgi:adenosine deaminase CECR1
MLDIALAQKQHGYRFYSRTGFHVCDDNENGPVLIYSHVNGPTYDKLSQCRKQDYTALESLTPAQRQSWLSAMKLDEPGENMNEFFEEIVNRLTPLFRDPYFFAEGFARNAKRFRAEGLRYIEAQWSPLGMEAPDGTRLAPDRAIAILKERMAQPDVAQIGLDFRFQTTIIRFREDLEQQIAAQFAFVDQHRDLWVGINAAGREDNDRGFALRMLNGMRQARRTYSGIPLSLHAGEKVSPGHEVRDTLLLGAQRIGHGINLIQDPDTMLLMRNNKYLVEINLVSNQLLNYVPDLKAHPFPEYLRFGIPVCLNTDDRGSWDSNMTDEYVHAVSLFRLTWEEVKQLGRNSLTYSFAPETLKKKMLESYEADLAAFEQRFAAGDWTAELGKVKAEQSGYYRRKR